MDVAAPLLLRRSATGCQVREKKGLDIVRRDWCELSRDVGNYALDQILSGRPIEDVVEAVHAKLREVSQAGRAQPAALLFPGSHRLPQAGAQTICDATVRQPTRAGPPFDEEAFGWSCR